MTVGGLADVEDHELLARAVADDDVAFGELLRRHQGAALRVAAVIAGSTDAAADIVQDALVKAHGRLGTFRGDGSVRSWLLRVVANEAKNHVRSRGRRRRLEDRHFNEPDAFVSPAFSVGDGPVAAMPSLELTSGEVDALIDYLLSK